MGDADNILPPSKKRAAGRELSRDNPGLDDEEDTSEQEVGVFKKASEEVLASRRIVKVRRQQSSTAPSSNPFAGVRLVPPSAASETTANATAAAAAEKTEDSEDNTNAEKKAVDDHDKKDNLSESVTDATVTGVGIDTERNENSTQATKQEVENETAGDSKIENEDKEGSNTEASKTVVDKTENEKTVQDINTAIEKKEDDKTEVSKPAIDDEKRAENDAIQNVDSKGNATEGAGQSAEGAPLSTFQSLSSTQNAFTGLAGTGFSTSTFSFGTIPKDGSSSSATSGSLFGQKTEQSPFSFSLPNNGSSLFGSAAASILAKSEGSSFPSMKEVPVETGEESEQVVFTADSVLFEYLDGTWKERGKGELKVNVSTIGTKKARILMRAKGNYRLILNAGLYPEMKLTNMDKKGVTFACVNSVSDSKAGLSTFAAKFRESSIVEEFRAAVMEHKGKVATALNTPEK